MGDNGNTGLDAPELASNEVLRTVAAGAATLAQGAHGDGVRALQEALGALALGDAMKADGSFGPKTHAAVVALQAGEGLRQTGIVDAATIAALDRRLAARRALPLDEAMARAAGLSPEEVAALGRASSAVQVAATAVQAAAAASRTDQGYFTDASRLPQVVPGAEPDPDSPPPAVDSVDDRPATTASGALAADRSARLDEVRRALRGDTPALAALDRLLAAGRLHAGALLPNLATMAGVPRAGRLVVEGGIDPHLVLAQVIRHVDNPLRVKQGARHGTCGAGTMEYVLLRVDPAELVRLLDGITREAGEVALRSGRVLRMPRNAIGRDASGRIDIDRLFQSALMNHATLMSWIFDYDNPEDNDSFWAALGGDSRVPLGNFTSLFQDIMGGSYTSVSALLRSGASVAEDVARALGRGEKVPILMKWEGGYHWVAGEKIERGADGTPASVILRNPVGSDSCQGNPPRAPLPEGCGRFRMTYADLAAHIHGATIRG
ncbi:peptidoglycan-binding domain-containing protein [Sorangium sp. So ce513]|uniref:peptidoglycan-binding domain-containing protein n=1 Tax=Sorangium sp. So ce513 TaxID=3133315 RepID=UPI003F5D9297